MNISEKPNEETIIKQIKKQNQHIPADASIVVIKTLEHTRNGNTNYTLIIETDIDTYKKILTQEKLSVQWDRCRVFEHLYVSRCYKCLGFAHSSKVCTKKQACYKCGGEHEKKDCTSKIIKCINCVNAVKNLNLDLDVAHEAYSSECIVWRRRLEREQQRPMKQS